MTDNLLNDAEKDLIYYTILMFLFTIFKNVQSFMDDKTSQGEMFTS